MLLSRPEEAGGAQYIGTNQAHKRQSHALEKERSHGKTNMVCMGIERNVFQMSELHQRYGVSLKADYKWLQPFCRKG